MGRIATDAFTRANAATLGANWTDQVAGWGISSNTAIHDSGNAGLAGNTVFTGAAWTGGADHFSEATLLTCTFLSTWGPTVRSATASQTMYQFDTADPTAASAVRLYKWVAGVATQLASATVTITANDVMRCEASGTTIRGVQNSVVQLTVTDSAIASGKPGLCANNLNVAGSATVDDWSAGDFVPGRVQHKAANQLNVSTYTVTLTNATYKGNLIVVGVVTAATPTINVPTDNATGGSNTYVRVTGSRSTGNSGALEVFYCANCKAGATIITVTLSAASFGDVFVFEASGMEVTSAVVDTVGLVNSGAASTTPVGGAVTTTDPNDYATGFIFTATSVTAMHAGDEFTIGDISNGNASADLIATATNTYSPQWDQASGVFCSSTVAFKPWVVAPPAITIIPVRESHSDFPKYPMTRQ